MANGNLPNRNSPLPIIGRNYPEEDPDERAWAEYLHDVLEEVNAHTIVSGPSSERTNYEPLEGTVFVPVDGGSWYIGTGTFWVELGELADPDQLAEFEAHLFDTNNPHSTSLEDARTQGSTIFGSINGVGVAALSNFASVQSSEQSADILRTQTHPVADVSAYGAVGDGTTDDTSEIQAALNSNAPRVYLPEGTYRITSEIAVGDKHLFGDGMGNTTISVDANMTRAVTVEGYRGGVSDLTVQGNANTVVGVRMTGTESFCDRVEADNVSQYGTINNTVACIACISALRCRVRDCVATRAHAPNSGVSRGIQLDGSSGGEALIEGNYVNDITPTGDGDGIIAQNGNPDCRIANNRVTNAAKSAIKINLGAENCSVVGNTLHAGPDALSVMRVQASGTSFTGNTIRVPSVSGELVRVSDAAVGASITGNTLELTDPVGGIEGIQVRLDEENITIAGNSIYMHGGGLHGIAVGTAKNVVISGNIIDECGGCGIDINGTRGFLANGNLIDDVGDNGIRVDSAAVRGIIDGNSLDATNADINNNSADVVVGDNFV